MNEIDFIRRQMATERRHFAAVKAALADILSRASADEAFTAFLERCVEFLIFVAGRFHAQDQAHIEKLRARLSSPAADERRALADLEKSLAARAAAIASLADRSSHALDASPPHSEGLLRACRDYVNFLETGLRDESQSLYHLSNEYFTLEDWREASFVTADSIVEERGLFANVCATAPDGVTLAS